MRKKGNEEHYIIAINVRVAASLFYTTVCPLKNSYNHITNLGDLHMQLARKNPETVASRINNK